MMNTELLLSTQRALLGAITPNMKAITIGSDGTTIKLRVYFLTTPNEDELEILSDITGEICSDITEIENFEEEALVVDPLVPVSELEMLDAWVFLQHSPILSV